MEIWKDISELNNLYQISNHGNIRSIDKTVIGNQHGNTVTRPGRVLKPYPGGKGLGYLRVSASIENRKTIIVVHRFVAKYFVPNPDNKPQVNHKDLNRYNNSADNLEWVTNGENMLHFYANRNQE